MQAIYSGTVSVWSRSVQLLSKPMPVSLVDTSIV